MATIDDMNPIGLPLDGDEYTFFRKGGTDKKVTVDNLFEDRLGEFVPKYTDLVFTTVADAVDGVTQGGVDLSVQLPSLINNGKVQVSILSQDNTRDGNGDLTSKYVLGYYNTLAQERLDRIDPVWVPDNNTSYYVLGGTTYILSPVLVETSADYVITADGRTVQEALDDLPEELDPAGTAAELIDEHNDDPSAHPALSAFITAEADRAEAAADVATINGNIYPDTTAGLGATVDGDYFSVPSSESDEYLILYLNNLGVADEIKTYPSSELVETFFNKNKRVYDLKNRVRFVDGELEGPFSAVDLTDVPGLVWQVNGNNQLEFTGAGATSRPEVFWLGHVRKFSKNTEVIMRLIMDGDWTGGGTFGPGPMIYFGDSDVKGYLYTESGRVAGYDGNAGGTAEYGSTPQDVNAIFGQGEEVELRIVFRNDGTGFAIGKKLSNGYELRLDLDETNLANFGEGKIWVTYHRNVPVRITHFEVNELEVIPEDFDQEQIASDISLLDQRVSLLEQTSGEKLIPYALPSGFSMYQDLGFEIFRGLSSRRFYTTFDREDYILSTTSEFYVDPDTGSDSNTGGELDPFATFAKAVTEANLLGGTNTIRCASGEYDYLDTGTIPQITCQLNILGASDTDRPEITTASVETGWTQDGTFTNLWFKAVSGTTPIHCYDKGTPDEYGGPKGLVQRSQTEANDTSGSYFLSGSTIYVRTYDDREPDSDFRVVRDLPMLDFSNQLFYLQDMIFRGGNTYTAVAPSQVVGTCVTSNCTFSHGRDQSFRWIRSSGTSRIIHHESETAWSRIFDGFSYTSPGSGTESIEIDCYGHHCGIDEGTTHNGSTIHTATRMIRINGEYKYNNNKNVADVSTGTQSVNLNIYASDAHQTSATSSINFSVGTGAEMWLDGCSSEGGSTTDFEVESATSTMRVRNTNLYLTSNIEDTPIERY